jgi:hypothetical protein
MTTPPSNPTPRTSPASGAAPDTVAVLGHVGEARMSDAEATTLSDLVVMAYEADALERDALGLAPANWSARPAGHAHAARGVVGRIARGVARALPWHARVAGLAAAAALAMAAWPSLAPWPTSAPTASDPASTNRGALAARGGPSTTGAAISVLNAPLAADLRAKLDWLEPGRVRFVSGDGAGWARATSFDSWRTSGSDPTVAAVLTRASTRADTDDGGVFLAVFRDDDAPHSACVRVEAGRWCGGPGSSIDRGDLVAAALGSPCADGAETVSIFALSGPMAKLPRSRDEAEALALTLADLPWECLVDDPCAEGVGVAWLPPGVSLVSKTLALR